MKKILFILINIVVLLTMCTEFPTRFDRVDSDEVRLLDFIYDPPEASPGDTVNVKAVFSGKKINISNIAWSFSPHAIVNKYGEDTAFNILPLPAVPQEDYFSDNTTCFSFQFVVPPDLFKTHPQIPDNWTGFLPQTILQSLPATVTGLTKGQLIDMVNLLTLSPQMYNVVSDQLQLPIEELSSTLPFLSQLFTVQMRFFADIKNGIFVESNYTVRYHSRFSKIPQIPVHVNHNPGIDSIGIYKVKGDIKSYSPVEDKHEFIKIDKGAELTSIVQVQKGYSYFLVAFCDHPDTFQTLFDLTSSSDTTEHLEKLSTIWFFQLNDNETRDISANKFMKTDGRDTKSYNINSPTSYNDLQIITRLYPPTDNSIISVNVWCQLQDNTYNELLHPVGSSLKEGSFIFQY